MVTSAAEKVIDADKIQGCSLRGNAVWSGVMVEKVDYFSSFCHTDLPSATGLQKVEALSTASQEAIEDGIECRDTSASCLGCKTRTGPEGPYR